jgi:sulfoquinovose isomerase
MIPWTALPRHRSWLAAEGSALLRFAKASRREAGGFAWLEADRTPRTGPVETWITARMTHCFSLAALQGIPGAAPYADHGVRTLTTLLRDDEHGGWFAGVDTDGNPLEDGRKSGYPHAFVVLSSSSATAAGRPGAAELLAEALRVVEQRFWDDVEGRCRESWDREWTLDESYRGANSNMHMVEAFLAAADVTGLPVWRERALSVCDHVVRDARDHGWRLVEHFDQSWAPDLEYNRDRPDDPFRPYGSTIGHWLEWSRLLLQLEAALPNPPRWLLEGAVAFFDLAVAEGWQVDGRPGFVYTVDWEGKPVVRTRMHWVLAEAILTAAALRTRTGEARYEDCYRTWWDHADELYLDRTYGSWHHELDPENRPSATVWGGKPDIYHAYQATLFPLLPLSPAASVALSRDDFTDARHSQAR